MLDRTEFDERKKGPVLNRQWNTMNKLALANIARQQAPEKWNHCWRALSLYSSYIIYYIEVYENIRRLHTWFVTTTFTLCYQFVKVHSDIFGGLQTWLRFRSQNWTGGLNTVQKPKGDIKVTTCTSYHLLMSHKHCLLWFMSLHQQLSCTLASVSRR